MAGPSKTRWIVLAIAIGVLPALAVIGVAVGAAFYFLRRDPPGLDLAERTAAHPSAERIQIRLSARPDGGACDVLTLNGHDVPGPELIPAIQAINGGDPRVEVTLESAPVCSKVELSALMDRIVAAGVKNVGFSVSPSP